MERHDCISRLSSHFSAAKSLRSNAPATNLTEARTTVAQMKKTADLADPKGCASEVVLGVDELRAGLADLEKSMSDGQVLMHGLFSMFDAGDSSPLSQQGRAAQRRVQAAVKLLKDAGVKGLD